ncbi:MAG: 16S rRNA processing protein RimM [Deltaproteobacteria bacterium]|nr:16S rRNA processing protein RimM [Deltaproteobacteria bacterium]
MILPDALLLVGKIIRPHGVRGLLRVWIYAGSESSFRDSEFVYIKFDSGEIEEYKLISARPHKKFFLIKLKRLLTKIAADNFSGAEIFIKKDGLSRDEGEYFWYELKGLAVYLNTGEYLGLISQIIPTSSNDIFVVKDGKREFLIPATYEVVREIDIENLKMTISLIDGLLNINEV